MKTILHKASTRGHANYGWLETHYTFSFSDYYNPERIHFGMLRVLNDDTIHPGEGFGMHPHDNMEIVTIPLEGTVEHRDSMGNSVQVSAGEIQVMTAGTGIYHSEFNASNEAMLRLLQIWVIPEKRKAKPTYSQVSIKDKIWPDQWSLIVSPDENDQVATIGQKAWFHLGRLSAGWEGTYKLKGQRTGVYAFLIEGKAEVAGQMLEKRDGLGISGTDEFRVKAESNSFLLLMEIPV